MLKGIGTDAALRLFMLQEIDNKAGEIRIIFQETLFQRLYEPMEALYKINLRQAKSKFSAITSDYPEITEIAILSKKGKYSPLFSKIKSETVRAKIAQTAPIVFDTSRWVGSSYFSDTTFNLKHNYLNIEGEDYFFQFISKEDKIVVEVSDFSIFKSLLPNIDQLMKEKNRRFYDTYFSRYPGEYTAEIKFYDQKEENFFTFGNPKGFG
jgi:hypothetical protein